VIVSTLIVERASPRHGGNYSCMVPGKAKTTVAVHVLNGEYVRTAASLQLLPLTLPAEERVIHRHVGRYLPK